MSIVSEMDHAKLYLYFLVLILPKSTGCLDLSSMEVISNAFYQHNNIVSCLLRRVKHYKP